jgi:hypothetical protein
MKAKHGDNYDPEKVFTPKELATECLRFYEGPPRDDIFVEEVIKPLPTILDDEGSVDMDDVVEQLECMIEDVTL